jgi:ABC-type transport system involved in multi-copper enzyme maturation permease subunit
MDGAPGKTGITHKLYSSALFPLAASTYGEITRRPVYSILLLSFAVAVFCSKFLALFNFQQEMNLVREMGMATLTFWSFIIVVITSGVVVTQELEDRTAVTLLSKPIRRHEFLLGKFLGLVLSLVPGTFILAGVLFLTLWMMAFPHLPLADTDLAPALEAGRRPLGAVWSAVWNHFVLSQGGVVLQGMLLSLFQSSILAALAVSFAAFFPAVVSAGAVTLSFILGNISSYMLASVENMNVTPLTWTGRAAATVLPNFGYFNLQTNFSEGRIISGRYVGLSFVYAALFVGAVFLVSCSLFRKREVR